ncbi:MAG TPA: carotenoid biosynthesis protein [Candidatus Competibacteraceae bacterium]|nr:carotenoid biosynthesis protein [Candidatus Competibacteraceae bacterium]
MAGVITVGVDLFIDPIAVKAGYWVWFKEGTVYYGVPLLNFVGWFVLMTLALLAWLWIAQQHRRSFGQKAVLAVGALLPLSLAAMVMSMALNGLLAALGWR